ncbi:hypothetical protein HPP92_017899 [Vanilla planifolia]|uniref:Uncharacterized protein n=1 Tax=Vanilla planifolia TaxID=51239 RepID=A0A835Q8V2_VANPL|nr:hypothetical protein HPP92_018468 [Vanilla planifolia]KAG0468571.1 hypothetical protein HPP92_017899 [Vanilla planifolia]
MRKVVNGRFEVTTFFQGTVDHSVEDELYGLRHGLKRDDSPHLCNLGLLRIIGNGSEGGLWAAEGRHFEPSPNAFDRMGSPQMRPDEPCRRKENSDLCSLDILDEVISRVRDKGKALIAEEGVL